jgi:hypothetical protein
MTNAAPFEPPPESKRLKSVGMVAVQVRQQDVIDGARSDF